MKSLSSYTQPRLTELFEECGVFFAFSKEQFDEGRKEGVAYVDMGIGMICPKEHAKRVLDEISKITEDCIKQDLEENGKDAIIQRELANHECWYVGDVIDCVYALADYPGITREDIVAMYRRDAHKHDC